MKSEHIARLMKIRGLGVHGAHLSNTVMLRILVWDLLKKPYKLCIKMITNKLMGNLLE